MADKPVAPREGDLNSDHSRDVVVGERSPGTDKSSRFRPDIEGLRAIAVGLVVLFHAGFPWFPGGYVGVDVFFVISGFLITGLLIREVQKSSKLSIKNFYVRRIRRILPMSTLVLVVTVCCAAWWMTATESSAASSAASWAAVFVANWYFAASASDYFDSSTQTNPILHFWSLGVEEQFYVIWPLLLIGAIVIARWRGASVRALLRGALIGLVVLCLISLWWSITKSGEEGQWAFFGLHTRLWELGAGGLLAFAVPRLRQLPRIAAELMSVVGIILIAFAAVTYTEQTVFPGVAALAPVLGTVLVIAAGSSAFILNGRPTAVGYILGTRPMLYIGARSYNLYLWHWPVLVFAAMWSSPKTFGGSDTSHLTMPVGVAVMAIVVALILTAVTYRLIEQPLRQSVFLKQAKTAFPAALGMIAIVLVATFAVTPAIHSARANSLDPTNQKLIAQAETIADELNTNQFWIDRQPCLDPTEGRMNRVMARWDKTTCTFGDPNGKTKIALIGDSHADMWLPMLDKIGKRDGISILYLAKSYCPLYALSSDTKMDLMETCQPWTEKAVAELKKEGPFDAVLVGRRSQNLHYQIFGKPNEQQNQQITDSKFNAFTKDVHYTFEQLATTTKNIVVLQDPSSSSFNIPACIQRAEGDASQCSFGREQGLKEELVVRDAERKAAQGLPTGVKVEAIDFAPILCSEDKTDCPAVIETQTGNFIVFRDTHHVPYGTSQALVDQLEPMLRRAIGQ